MCPIYSVSSFFDYTFFRKSNQPIILFIDKPTHHSINHSINESINYSFKKSNQSYSQSFCLSINQHIIQSIILSMNKSINQFKFPSSFPVPTPWSFSVGIPNYYFSCLARILRIKPSVSGTSTTTKRSTRGSGSFRSSTATTPAKSSSSLSVRTFVPDGVLSVLVRW